jgi:hypothetical protein
MLPEARRTNLVCQDVGDEVLIYDQDQHRVHRLNRSAGLVWKRCDGQTSVSELAALLHRELDLPLDDELVMLALHRLEEAGLLKTGAIKSMDSKRVTRRQLSRRLALSGARWLLIPAIVTLSAPTIASAQSGSKPISCGGDFCNVINGPACKSPCFCDGVNPRTGDGICNHD